MLLNKGIIVHLQSRVQSITQIQDHSSIDMNFVIMSPPPRRRPPKMSPKQVPPKPRPMPAGPPLINGVAAIHVNAIIRALTAMPFARAVTLRPNRTFIAGKGRASNEEAWLGTRVGTLATRQCTHCAKGSGPFKTCVFIEGHFKESCTNCRYGGLGNRCSFRLS